jgi:hypothetical protein
MQESICADAASFDLFPNNLTACIAEAHECIKLCAAKRSIEKSADKQFDPENYAILKGELKFFQLLKFAFRSILSYTSICLFRSYVESLQLNFDDFESDLLVVMSEHSFQLF